jgi:hypothetical protein
MPTFKAPLYTKTTNPKTGVQEPCYTFPIDFNLDDVMLSFVAESISDVTLQSLQKCILENVVWWNTFIGYFLQSSSKLFSKPYTVENINKIAKHTLNTVNYEYFPVNVILVPKSIQISGGIFLVNWSCIFEQMVIDIPDLVEPEHNTEEATLPVSDKTKLVDGMEELNIDEIPVRTNSTDEELKLDSPAKFYDKQRVKETRLKAKLAVYKAQRQMAQYYEKYGTNISDSDSDSDFDSDSESDEDTTEDIQL